MRQPSLAASVLGVVSAITGEYAASTTYIQRSPTTICPAFPHVENARYECDDAEQLEHNSVCTLKCLDNYENAGPKARTCNCFTKFGPIEFPKQCTWDGEEFTRCSIKSGLTVPTCPRLPNIMHGKWVCERTREDSQDGDVCYSTCEDGFALTETNLRAIQYDCDCEDDKCLWSQRGGVLDLVLRQRSAFVLGKGLHGMTRSGIKVSSDWDTSIFRDATAIFPQCVPIEREEYNAVDNTYSSFNFCPALIKPENGNFLCTQGTREDTICKLTCDEGFLEAGYGDRNRLKCGEISRGVYDWRKNPLDFVCLNLDVDFIEHQASYDIETCDDPRGSDREQLESYPGFFTCDMAITIGEKSIFLKEEVCELTCFPGYRLSTARSEKECFCRKENCFWRGEDKVKCEPDEEVLRAFGIYEIWANLDARRQVELVKQELGDKEEEITLYRKQQTESLMMQRSAPKKKKEQGLLQARSLGAAKQRPARVTSCQMIAPSPGMRSAKCSGSHPGASCRFRCETGLKISGASSIYCSCNRRGSKCNWSKPAPICEK